jgi:putative ABC transport system permease protein
MIGLIFLLITAAVLGFGVMTTGRWLHGLWFAAAVVSAFVLLVFVARLMAGLMKRVAPGFLSYAWRQGLANLHRPKNQTSAVMLSIGLGTFLLVTLYSVQSMLLNQIAGRSGKGEPNLVLFDVQKDQREGMAALFTHLNIRGYEEVPIVTMRLARIKGRPVEELRSDPNSKISAWALRREYRSTYRTRLTATEEIIDGEWRGRVDGATAPVPISLERGIAETLGVTIGDELQFEIQGVPVAAQVSSIREVDWQRVQPNFFVVFPEGVLEDAPQFYAIVTRTDSSELSARVQRAVVERFPNVSMIDLTLVLSTLDSILGRVAAAIRFVALFTILTGLSVLASAVLSSRAQRIRESILLRTLGAARGQILGTIAAEYLFLGMISGATGALLGVAAAWGLSFYFLETAAAISPAPIAVIFALVTAATVLAGMLGCWGIFQRPALEALRAET